MRKTNRLVTVEEGFPQHGIGAEIWSVSPSLPPSQCICACHSLDIFLLLWWLCWSLLINVIVLSFSCGSARASSAYQRWLCLASWCNVAWAFYDWCWVSGPEDSQQQCKYPASSCFSQFTSLAKRFHDLGDSCNILLAPSCMQKLEWLGIFVIMSPCIGRHIWIKVWTVTTRSSSQLASKQIPDFKFTCCVQSHSLNEQQAQ